MITGTMIRDEAKLMQDSKAIMERVYDQVLDNYNRDEDDTSIEDLKQARMMFSLFEEACDLLHKLEEVYDSLNL